MKRFLLYLQNNQTQVSILLLFMISVAVVVYLNPREAKFKYEFQKGKPWMHDNLLAPFDFNILKSAQALEQERMALLENKTIFVEKKPAVAANARESFRSGWAERFAKAKPAEAKVPGLLDSLREQGLSLLDSLFDQGILKPNENSLFDQYGEVLLREESLSEPVELAAFLTLREAAEAIETSLARSEPRWAYQSLRDALVDELDYNLVYDEATTEKYLQSQLEEILPTRGAVEEGELIVFKGNLVDDEKYAKLQSLKQVYEGSLSGNRSYYFLLGGQILLVGILFLVLYLFLREQDERLTEDISRLSFILLNVLIMVAAARLVMDFGYRYLYLVPFAVLPMILRAFFNATLAIFVHVLAMLIIGFLVPNSFEFTFLQFVAGVFSVLLVNNLYKRSQLFLTAGKITLVYCLAYFSLAILQEGRPQNIDYLIFGFFVANGLLTLVTYPMIYLQEKLFGLVSEVSLLELGDTNNPLLRRLAQSAPGTFQHSLQVANLAEAAVNAIKGRPLLVRTGALYHDIGKMNAPMYYIENQSTGINPHDELSFEESAEIIINHVREGIKMAKKEGLPDILIDFIRTHHGTSTVMYFYRQYIKNFPEEENALQKFTYPGPKPFSKETAVLMMADTVEAACRSLSKPDHDKIDRLVENLVDAQIDQGQFENAPITLKEIRTVKKIFKKMLTNIYHVRIAYPD